MRERLQKILSARGVASRRRGEELIQAGQVTVNGFTASLGDTADPDTDDIRVGGQPLPKQDSYVYILLNKPRGYVTTLSDEDGSILAEGTFAPGTELRTSEEQGETPATKGEVLLHQSVSVDGGAPFTALRVLKPENVRKAELWCRTEQGPWRQLACTKEGSYLRAELETNAAELCLVKTESGTTIWIGGAVALAAVGILLLAVGHKPQKPKGSCEKKARIPEKV